MRITKFEGTAKELAEFYNSFPVKKAEEKKLSDDPKFFSLNLPTPTETVKAEDKVATLVKHTFDEMKKREFTPFETLSFLYKLQDKARDYVRN